MNEIQKKLTWIIRRGIELEKQPDVIAYKAIEVMRNEIRALVEEQGYSQSEILRELNAVLE